MVLPGLGASSLAILFLQVLGNIVTGVKDDMKVAAQTVGAPPYSIVGARRAPPYCPLTNDLALNWTKPMGDIEFAYLSSFKQLWCCASGYRNISWRRKSEGSVWQNIKYGAGIMLNMTQQQLIIRKFTKEDEGVYQCRAEGRRQGQQMITHEYRVIMDDPPVCNTEATPVFGNPHQNDTVYVGRIGEDKTITCLVSFGKKCGMFVDPLAVVRWIEAVNGSCSEYVDYQTDAKTIATGEDRLLMSGDLLLTNITESDFGRQWCCKASKNNRDYTTMVVGLQAPIKPQTVVKTEPASLKLILSVVLSAVGVTIITLLLLWVYRLEILLLHHTKYGKRPQQENFEYLHDLILIHSSDDYNFVRDVLAANLEDRWHYRVFLPKRDLEIGYEDAAWMEGVRKSRKLVWIVSANFLAEQKCGTIHNYIIAEKRNNDVIYIHYHDIPNRLWESNDVIPNIEVLHKSVKNAGRSWLRLGKTLHWCEDYDEKIEGRIVLNANKTKVFAKFWKQLRLYLPPRNERAPPENSESRPHRSEGGGDQGTIAVCC
ncbi:uncharacterized protein LOC135487081 [Lineus longissimus]|uniref:uncharacterized protein LOC135487081 n=1 Tax=Lineus longissimus TaxID=88925 RepID=UPI002B4F09AB